MLPAKIRGTGNRMFFVSSGKFPFRICPRYLSTFDRISESHTVCACKLEAAQETKNDTIRKTLVKDIVNSLAAFYANITTRKDTTYRRKIYTKQPK